MFSACIGEKVGGEGGCRSPSPLQRFDEITALWIFEGPTRQLQLRELKDLSSDNHDVIDDVMGVNDNLRRVQSRFKFRRVGWGGTQTESKQYFLI